MIFFLTSIVNYYYKDSNGNRYSKKIDDENLILTNLLKSLKNFDIVVFVANNSTDVNENDIRAKVFFEALDKTNLKFKNKILLDERNKNNAKKIIQNANLIFLTGGRIFSGKHFYDSINLKRLLKNSNAVVIGASAGSMLLCNNILNFPEMLTDTFNASYVKGLKLVKNIIYIPHFNGEKKQYEGNAERDIINDYLIPFSFKKEMIGVPNGSYIIADNNKTTSYGDIYLIKKGKIEKT